MKVFINPGHSFQGEPDPGSIEWDFGFRESDLVFRIGQKVQAGLQIAGCETRLLQSDNLIGESQGECVTRAANHWQADAFLSLHCDARYGTQRGMDLRCFDATGISGRFARCIQDSLYHTLVKLDPTLPEHPIKQRPEMAPLWATEMPAVLVELGAINHHEDLWLMTMYDNEIAQALVRGVLAFEEERRKW